MRDFDEEPVLEASGPGTVKVNHTTIEYNARQMFQSIAQCAAEQIVHAIKRDLEEDVRKSVRAQIQLQVGEKVAEVLDTDIQPTNEFGEPKGPATTLRSMAADAARNYLGTKVNKDGVPNQYHSDQTRLEFLVKKAVADTFNYQMASEVRKAADLARAEAMHRMSSVVAEVLVKGK